MVAIDAVIRASEVTLPSLTGTFRSERIKTRLPFKSKSVILMKEAIATSSLCKSVK